ncbi:hypothetical protein ACFYWN_23505 [Streptomyces sp. NPDC002917]|nr:hypothetical protein [Streptomyces sp. NBC_00562]WTD31266.1 hypothetical protein OHB03_02855 [Streptomyces sp. NBC_01643]WUC17933.1 hypothetical protein OHA33_03080 [Streptomyces sp. NBC_00562]
MADFYDSLGLTPAVNANGKMTALGGSRLSGDRVTSMGVAC